MIALALAGAALVSSPARGMNFSLFVLPETRECRRDCQLGVLAEGPIANETADRFESFMATHPSRSRIVIFLNSTGGAVVGAMRLGKAFRAVKANLVVAAGAVDGDGAPRLTAGKCLSACAYAFLGGVSREVPTGSAIGIHRMFSRKSNGLLEMFASNTHDDGSIGGVVANYATSMGVSADLASSAERYGSGDMHILTREEMRRWRVVTKNE